jgi:hypothetical protein
MTETADPLKLPWRTGSRNDRAIYYVLPGRNAEGSEQFIGTLDTPELVAEAVAGHNALLEARQA